MISMPGGPLPAENEVSPDASSADRIKIVEVEGTLELHGLAHRLWEGGERTLAPKCLRLAAQHALPEAATDVLVWEATGGRSIFGCCDDPSRPGEEPRAETDRERCASRFGKSGVRYPGVLKAAAASAVGAAVAASGIFVWSQTQIAMEAPSLPAVRTTPTAPLNTERPVAQPTVDATFAPEPAAGERASAPRSGPSPSPQLKVDLGGPPSTEYVMTLNLGSGEQACSWRIVGSAPDRPSGEVGIHLDPGQERQVSVPASNWSSVSVFSESDGRDDCKVVTGTLAEHSSTATTAAAPTTTTSMVPAPTVSTSTPLRAPAPQPPPISPPAVSPTPTSRAPTPTVSTSKPLRASDPQPVPRKATAVSPTPAPAPSTP